MVLISGHWMVITAVYSQSIVRKFEQISVNLKSCEQPFGTLPKSVVYYKIIISIGPLKKKCPKFYLS